MKKLLVDVTERITPGVYESDDIKIILSSLPYFDRGDVVVFDVDKTLITNIIDSDFLERFKEEILPLKELELLSQKQLDGKLFLYRSIPDPKMPLIKLVDDRIPMLIKNLQLGGIKCLGNTSRDPIITFSNLSFDVSRATVSLLKSLGIDFSYTIPVFSSWTFDALGNEKPTTSSSSYSGIPTFKDGIIFSSQVPKHITQLELFKKLKIMPKKLAFIDDSIENVQGMYDFMSSSGVECYAFCYSKKKLTLSSNYFPKEAYTLAVRKLETWIHTLLLGEDTYTFYVNSHLAEFLIYDKYFASKDLALQTPEIIEIDKRIVAKFGELVSKGRIKQTSSNATLEISVLGVEKAHLEYYCQTQLGITSVYLEFESDACLISLNRTAIGILCEKSNISGHGTEEHELDDEPVVEDSPIRVFFSLEQPTSDKVQQEKAQEKTGSKHCCVPPGP